jgi:hypothetical protein
VNDHKYRVQAIASSLFGELTTPPKKNGYLTGYRYITLTLDDNNAPIIILHDGQGNTLATAKWDREKWYREK